MKNDNKPFLLKPAYKDYLWGGNKLKEKYNKKTDITPLAETWECSTHPDGPSIVASGEYSGELLSDVIRKNPHFLGTKNKGLNELPILVKFIDAQNNLSIQVHPDDEYARINENGSLGKNEFWYVLDAEEGSKLVFGFKKDVSREIVEQAIKENEIEKYLNQVETKKGDGFFIEAGTIHAICAGNIILEVQQNSNVTYRVYDYNRKDKYGNFREMHIEKSLDVINYNESKSISKNIKISDYYGYSIEEICKTEYFCIEKIDVKTEYEYTPNEKSFEIYVCIDGFGHVSFNDEKIDICIGDVLFVPANARNFCVNNTCLIIKIT